MYLKQYDPHIILGVQRDASVAKIKKAYQELSRVFHPDKQGNVQYFSTIHEAYKVLANRFRTYLLQSYGKPVLELYDTNSNLFYNYQQKYHQLLTSIQQCQQPQELIQLIKQLNQLKQQVDEQTQLIINKFAKDDVLSGFVQRIQTKVDLDFSSEAFKLHSLIRKVGLGCKIPLPNLFNLVNVLDFDMNLQSLGRSNSITLKTIKSFITPQESLKIQSNLSTNLDRFRPSWIPSIEYSNKSIWFNLVPFSVQAEGIFLGQLSIQKMLNNTQNIAQISLGKLFFQSSTLLGERSKIKAYFISVQQNLQAGFGREWQITHNFKFFINLALNLSQNRKNLALTPKLVWGVSLGSDKKKSVTLTSTHLPSRQIFDVKFQDQNRLTNFSINSQGLIQQAAKFIASFLLYVFNRLQQKSRPSKLGIKYKRNQQRQEEGKRKVQSFKDQFSRLFSSQQQFQIDFNGLVICNAIFGKRSEVSKVSLLLTANRSCSPSEYEYLAEQSSHIDLLQAVEIREYVQRHVNGSRLKILLSLIQKDLYNPCFNQKHWPSIYIRYFYRGNLSTRFFSQSQNQINLPEEPGLGKGVSVRMLGVLESWLFKPTY